MRKYHQLFLVILSAISFLLLIYYFNEYIKLRYVLSALNFFGAPMNGSCAIFYDNSITDPEAKDKFVYPTNTWSPMGTVYIFSSYWGGNYRRGHSRTLAIGKKTAFNGVTCRVWFEHGDVLVSKQGKFLYHINSDVDYTTNTSADAISKYWLKCKVKDIPTLTVPYGVLFSWENNKRFSPIMFKKPNIDIAEFAICVRPDYSGMPKTRIIELLSFYSVLGVPELIFYDSGIQHALFPFLGNVGGYDKTIPNISIINWNFPFINPAIEYATIKDDCLSRTSGRVKTVAIISLDEYIVPTSLNNITDMIPHSENGVMFEIKLHTFICCTDWIDDIASLKSWPLVLRKTECIPENENTLAMYTNPKYFHRTVRKEIQPEKGVVYRFKDCANRALNMKSVKSDLLRYKEHFLSHRLFELWKIVLYNKESTYKEFVA